MLKEVVKRITIFFLAGLILTVGSGFTLNKMDCLMSENSFYSLDVFDCCSDEDKEESITQKCCDYSSLNLRMEVETLLKSSTVTNLDFEMLLLQNPSIVFKAVSQLFIFNFQDLPPPLCSLNKLSFIQVFRL